MTIGAGIIVICFAMLFTDDAKAGGDADCWWNEGPECEVTNCSMRERSQGCRENDGTPSPRITAIELLDQPEVAEYRDKPEEDFTILALVP